jgi:protein-S-isoprenylcysteine O-methyltransferase Ste14
MASRLLLRALAAFLLLPGLLAIALPAFICSVDPARRDGHPLGLAPLVVGFAILASCVRDFYVAGRGTLAPWDPPVHLVTAGLYRFVRNPMYAGILVAVAGWGFAAGSITLGVYTLALFAAFHLRVVRYEEPTCAARFGQCWQRYAGAVPRWLPRLTPWRSSLSGGT